MLYMFLLYWNPAEAPGEPEAVIAEHLAFAQAARERDAYIYSESLGDGANATTVRVRNGEAVTIDGPYAETKEVLGGLYVLDCADLDEAIEYAKRIPDAAAGAVEVRPVVNVPGWPYEIAAGRRRS